MDLITVSIPYIICHKEFALEQLSNNSLEEGEMNVI